jgi:hypothetical protein
LVLLDVLMIGQECEVVFGFCKTLAMAATTMMTLLLDLLYK